MLWKFLHRGLQRDGAQLDSDISVVLPLTSTVPLLLTNTATNMSGSVNMKEARVKPNLGAPDAIQRI